MKYSFLITQALLFFTATFFVGCASTDKGTTLDKLIINNRTGSDMEDVALRVPATGLLIACSTILEDRQFALGFPETENQNNPAVLEWVQNGRSFSRQIVNRREVLSASDGEQPFVVIVDVFKGGHLEIRLEAEDF